MIRGALATLALLTAAAGCSAAQETSVAIAPQTSIEFALGATLHTVHGTFQAKRGDMRLNLATGQASGEVVVDASTGASGNSSRDKRMHKDVLESARYPEIVFRPERVDGKLAPEGASHVQLRGEFLIHGAAHEISIPADVEAAGGKYAVVAKFSIPYAKWGMKNPSTLFLRVSDQVEITVRTSVVLGAPRP